MEHLFAVNLIANEQSKIVPKLTERGFVKRKIPKDVYASILTNRKKLLNSGEKWKVKINNHHILRPMIMIEAGILCQRDPKLHEDLRFRASTRVSHCV